MQAPHVSSAKYWWLLAAGPLLFLLAFVCLSIAFTLAGTPEPEVPTKVSALVPHCLVFVLICLGIAALRLPAETLRAWKRPSRTAMAGDLVIGTLCGVSLAALYFAWLEPALVYLQRSLGDFVPPGAVAPALSSHMGVFFTANVLLAPLVEETVYRGIAIPALSARLGVSTGVLLSSVAFGLLHWAGGLWYILLTGVVAGGCFAALYVARGGILAPFTAHLVLNVVEFAHAYYSRIDA